MDLTQLQGLIIVLVTIKLVALTYYISKMNAREKKMDIYLTRMDEHLNMLETRMTRLYTRPES